MKMRECGRCVILSCNNMGSLRENIFLFLIFIFEGYLFRSEKKI